MLIKSVLRPVENANLVRLGPKGDGGYVVPEDQIKDCELLISLGLSDNWLFDKEFLARNPHARVVGVDHTVGPFWFLRRTVKYAWKVVLYTMLVNGRKRSKYIFKLKNAAAYFSFFNGPHRHIKKRVSNRESRIDISLGRILESYQARNSNYDVFLKMDIEGAEYEVTRDIERCHERIRCMVAEFHDLDERTDDFNGCMQTLLHHFSVVHIHGNNGARYDRVNNFPSVVEITFVNKSLYVESPSVSTADYPRDGLDFPNNPGVPDYKLSFD